MSVAEIMFIVVFGILIILITILEVRDLKKKHKGTKEGMKWIDFRDLVNSDNSFNSCPNCGTKEIVTPGFGTLPPMYCAPECQNCQYRFVLKHVRFLLKGFKLKGFNMMSPETYQEWQDEEIRKINEKKRAKLRA